MPFDSVSCPTASRCWGSGPFTVAGSGDGGVSWQRQASTAIAGLYLGPARINGVSCPTTSSCAAAGSRVTLYDGTITSTSDGGASWDAQLVWPSDLYAISCPASNRCWAVGSHGTIIAES
jgi:photosystem II stability/assembly factor-like uncharacterized protein